MKELILELYKQSIKLIETIEKTSIDNNMLDTQEYLNWKDELNRLSIDENRLDS